MVEQICSFLPSDIIIGMGYRFWRLFTFLLCWNPPFQMLVYPAYRVGYFVQKDKETRWPSKFDWKVTVGGPKGMCMGWFGSLESAYIWMYKFKLSNIKE